MKLLIIYMFCTFGGVERVILNRIEAFNRFKHDIKIDMVFLRDGGGFESFTEYIKSFNLSKYIDSYLLNGDIHKNLRLSEYDMVLNIDTPSVFEELSECKNLYVECHTSYRKNRSYLKSLPDNVKAVVVPSKAFRNEIRSEIPRSVDLYVLPNIVSGIFFGNHYKQTVFFKKRPIAYMARLDELKNINEAIRIFEEFKTRDDVMYIIIGNGATDKSFVSKLKEAGLLSKSFIRPKINFDKVPQFLNLLEIHEGIFLYPSKAESFSMSVAESIASSVPVVASDIPPHRDLLDSNMDFLYSTGNIKAAKENINNILDNWHDCNKTMKHYAERFKDRSFIEAWENFIYQRRGK